MPLILDDKLPVIVVPDEAAEAPSSGLRPWAQSCHKSFKIMPSNALIGAGARHLLSRGGLLVTISMNKMGTAGILVAVAMCCGTSAASAQLYLNVGPGNNSSAQQITTNNLGLGGAGSATQFQGLNEPAIGANRGLSLPLLNQQAVKPLGVTGNAAGTGQNSLSAAGDRASSPVNSVTNSLTGPVPNPASPAANSAAPPVAKRKQTNIAGASSSSSRGAAAQVSPSKNP
jgi:hypothetical protein